MSINKFNSEGYYDPTAYEALTAIEKEKNGNQVKPIMENASQIYNTTSNRISTRDFITDELVIGRPESQPRGNNQPKRDKTIKI